MCLIQFMVKIHLRRSPQGAIQEVRCQGHAGFDDEGLDIVCAGVSALVGYLGIAFTEIARLPAELSADDGVFHLVLCEPMNQQDAAASQLLLESFAAAVSQLAEHYQGYLELEVK